MSSPELLFKEIIQDDDFPLFSEPIELVSVVADVPGIGGLRHLSRQYEGSGFDKTEELAQHLQKQCLEDPKREIFLDIKSKSGCHLLMSTNDPAKLLIKLTEHVFHHNYYVSRYLKFVKETSPKTSTETGIFYSASVVYPCNDTRQQQDLSYLIKNEFHDSHISLLAGDDVDISGFDISFQNPTFAESTTPPDVILAPLGCSEFEEPYDMFEYLSLVHLCQPPPRHPDSHTQVVSMYSVPVSDGHEEKDHINIATLKNLCPKPVNDLMRAGDYISFYARSGNQGVIVFNGKDKRWCWSMRETRK